MLAAVLCCPSTSHPQTTTRTAAAAAATPSLALLYPFHLCGVVGMYLFPDDIFS